MSTLVSSGVCRAVVGNSLLLTGLLAATQASALSVCSASMAEGTHCEIQVRDLHPTQIGVGLYEVGEKVTKISDMDEQRFERYVDEHQVPVVAAPGGIFYLTDRHHVGLSIIKARGDQEYMKATIAKNWSDKTLPAFWDLMKSANFVYLYDEQGHGPLTPDSLPTSLTGLKNDPYRSLAWLVRRDGAFDKIESDYADFKWANFFRTRVTISGDDVEAVLSEAKSLARSDAARDLPGYKGAGGASDDDRDSDRDDRDDRGSRRGDSRDDDRDDDRDDRRDDEGGRHHRHHKHGHKHKHHHHRDEDR